MMYFVVEVLNIDCVSHGFNRSEGDRGSRVVAERADDVAGARAESRSSSRKYQGLDRLARSRRNLFLVFQRDGMGKCSLFTAGREWDGMEVHDFLVRWDGTDRGAGREIGGKKKSGIRSGNRSGMWSGIRTGVYDRDMGQG